MAFHFLKHSFQYVTLVFHHDGFFYFILKFVEINVIDFMQFQRIKLKVVS